MKLNFCLKLLFLFGILSSFSAHAFQLYEDNRHWESTTLGATPTVTWGFADTGSECRIGTDDTCVNAGTVNDITEIIPGETPGVIFREADRAFNTWSDVANISFEFATDNPDILLGGHSIDGRADGATRNTLAHTFRNILNAGTNNEIFNFVDIHFDTDDIFNLTADETEANPGSGFFFNFLTHEIGHALGLDHEEDVNSIMMGLVPNRPEGLQADDIAGIQEIYGAPVTAVPLPAAVWMMLSGLGFITAMRKRVAAS
jgi:hypothetical protein